MAHADLAVRMLGVRGRARTRRAAGLVFVGTAMIVEIMALRYAPIVSRTIAAGATGLLAGPLAGIAVGIGSTYLAFALPGTKALPGLAAIAGGLAGGLVHRYRPALARSPAIGFAVGAGTTLIRLALEAPGVRPTQMGSALWAVVLGAVGVAGVVAISCEARAREDDARAAALAEIRALQARMDPHFLFNALNAISALSTIDPDAVPSAISQLGRFLRWGLDRHDCTTVPLREELDLIDAYLALESMRMSTRVVVDRAVPPEFLDSAVPPLSIQPLVENAVKHGILPSCRDGRLTLTAHSEGSWLVVAVADDGVGLAALPPRDYCEGENGGVHALNLLARRLRGLYGSAATLDLRGGPVSGTIATLRLPHGLAVEVPGAAS